MNAMKKLFTFVLLTAFLMSSFFGVAHAVFVVDPAASTDTPAGKPVVDPGIGKPQGKPVVDPAMAPANAPLNIHLNNPLAAGGVSTIGDAINKILSLVIRIALPIIILMFIWSGLSFIFARGNPEKIKVAKNMFLYTVIGTLLILGAWTITNAIIGTVNAITGY
jgi:hypothetical protein